MDQHRDDHLVCTSCGDPFVFSAAEAAVFAQRGLTSPKRCKSCRKARKEQGSAPRADGNGRGPGHRPDLRSRPRYTGDVNEYRSPMQDSSAPTTWQRPPGPDRGPRRAYPRMQNDGNYRAPSYPDASAGDPNPPRSGGRQRPRGDMHSITCSSCGAGAEVPFKPAEGREVFCQTCYRARKPA